MTDQEKDELIARLDSSIEARCQKAEERCRANEGDILNSKVYGELLKKHAALVRDLAEEKDRTDRNWPSLERIKQKLSDSANENKALVAKVAQLERKIWLHTADFTNMGSENARLREALEQAWSNIACRGITAQQWVRAARLRFEAENAKE